VTSIQSVGGWFEPRLESDYTDRRRLVSRLLRSLFRKITISHLQVNHDHFHSNIVPFNKLNTFCTIFDDKF
jgi:hypothetical protein